MKNIVSEKIIKSTLIKTEKNQDYAVIAPEFSLAALS